MSAQSNIVASGLYPKPSNLERRVMGYTEDICRAFTTSVKASLDRIHEAESAAVDRLQAYWPTEPLLTRQQAAAYLGLKLRQLDVLTRPGSTAIPFNYLGKQKRFRKVSLDRHLDETEIKKAKVRL